MIPNDYTHMHAAVSMDAIHNMAIPPFRLHPVCAAGAPAWSIRGLLDFNMAFSRFPAALPLKPGSYPPDPPGAAFTLLREGDAWLDEDHNLIVAVERILPCTEQPLVSLCCFIQKFNFCRMVRRFGSPRNCCIDTCLAISTNSQVVFSV